MKKLPQHIQYDGYYYRLLYRTAHWAIYSQHPSAKAEPIAYEVFRIRKAAARMLKGISYPKRETMPSPSEWGRDAWTFTDKARALKRYFNCTSDEEEINYEKI